MVSLIKITHRKLDSMDEKYREGQMNICFFLPIDIAAELRKQAIKSQTTLRELLTGLVLDYLGMKEENHDEQ